MLLAEFHRLQLYPEQSEIEQHYIPANISR